MFKFHVIVNVVLPVFKDKHLDYRDFSIFLPDRG